MSGTRPFDQTRSLAGAVCPEIELLLICSRTPLEKEHAERACALVAGGLSWEYLLRAAAQQGVAPLLYWHLATLSPDRIPGAVLGVFRSLFRTHFREARFLSGELVRILGLLQAGGIPAIPYKGPTLAQRLYGHLSLRPFCDLDLLVHPSAALTAMRVLESAGYRSELRFTAAQQAAYLGSGCELVLRNDEGPAIVELHWRVVPGTWAVEFVFEDLLRRAETTLVAGTPVLSLAPADLLLVLCVHGCKHLWEKLGMVCDVAQLVRAGGLNWEAVLRQAHELGTRRILLLGLTLAHDLLQAPVPPEILGTARRDRWVPSLAAEVERGLRGVASPASALLRRNWFALRCRERPADRARYLLRTAFTPGPEDWASLSLPPAWFPLYRILRPARLLKTHGLSALGGLAAEGWNRLDPLRKGVPRAAR